MKKFAPYLLTAFLALNQSFAGEHETVDLRQKHPDIFKFLGVMNQGSFGTCYLYSSYIAAEFFHKLQLKHKKLPLSSGISIGELALITDNGGVNVDGGHPFEVFRAINTQEKLCDSTTLGPDLDGHIFQLLNSISARSTYLEIMRLSKNGTDFNAITPQDWIHLTESYNLNKNKISVTHPKLAKLLKPINQKDFKKNVVASFTGKTFYSGIIKKDLSHNLRELCKSNQITAPHFQISVVDVRSKEKASALQKIWKYFSNVEPGPVAITGCISSLNDGRDCARNASDLHAMVILGRRLNFGSREFLVRNSWGKTDLGLPDPNARGEAWVSESLLHGFLTDVTFIEPK